MNEFMAYEFLFKESPNAIVIANKDGKIIHVNNEFSKLFQYEETQVIGKLIDDIIVPTNLKSEAKKYTEIAKTERKISFESYREDSRGNRIFISCTGLMFQFDGNEGIIAIYRVITKPQSIIHYKQLFQSVPEAIIIADVKGKIYLVNDEFENTFGYSLDEVKDEFIDEIIVPPRYVEEAREWTELIANGEKVENQDTIRKNKSGETFPVSFIGSRFIVDGKKWVCAIYRNIKNQRNCEFELNHRLNNYIDMITGYITDVENEIADQSDVVALKLKNIRSHCDTIGEVHQMFKNLAFLKRNMNELEWKSLLSEIIRKNFIIFNVDDNEISYDIVAEVDDINKSTTFLVAKLYNEIIMNSLKHAFPENRKGNLQVILKKIENQDYTYEFSIADDGIGFSIELFDREKLKSSGLKIIDNLVYYDLKGVYRIDKSNGTKYVINFNNKGPQNKEGLT